MDVIKWSIHTVKEMAARRRDLSFGRSKVPRPFFSALKLKHSDV